MMIEAKKRGEETVEPVLEEKEFTNVKLLRQYYEKN